MYTFLPRSLTFPARVVLSTDVAIRAAERTAEHAAVNRAHAAANESALAAAHDATDVAAIAPAEQPTKCAAVDPTVFAPVGAGPFLPPAPLDTAPSAVLPSLFFLYADVDK